MDQLTELNPDLIALQEVSLQGETSNAHWIADQLNHRQEDPGKVPPYQVLVCPKTGGYAKKEGIAVLSRFRVRDHESLDLLSQNRVAQIVRLRINDTNLIVVNVHLFWQPGVSEPRQQQIELLLDYLDTQPVEEPVIVCGDFNGIPGSPAIERMRQYFDSAHNIVNKQEPEYTCPTPLPQPKSIQLRTFIMSLLRKRPKSDPEWRGTLDYIFVDPRLQTLESRVVLDQPSADNLVIYPSDHFGLWAVIKVT